MRIVILENDHQVSLRAADLICAQIAERHDSVLGLATGGTPLGTYRELVSRASAGHVDFSACTTFNLDEYVGLPPEHDQSYRHFMHTHLFSPGGFRAERCHLPDGMQHDLKAAAESYEQQIADSGGIDLQLLGIGTDGHIAFNEPGSSLSSRTRLKALAERTRQDNARFFASLDEVPRVSLTMGIGSILDARKIVLLATGAGKADAVAAFVEGPITAQMPASALQLHAATTVIVDESAAELLLRQDYYRHVERIQYAIDQGQAY